MAAGHVTSVLSAALLVGALAVGAAASAPAASAAPVPTAPAAEDFGYQPLWPFTSQAEANRWLREGAAQGHSPWHGDPAATALAFTQNYLDFTEIDRTTTVTEHVTEAWVGVGYELPNGKPTTAGTIHLARFGSTPDAPWEVVGTVDDALTLQQPQYGSTVVGEEIEAGGTITGVDESLHLQIRQVTREGVLGATCCIPAGGEDRPWSATVPVTSAREPGALTLVVWTGGHVAEVERFAVTGLRAG